VLHRKMQTLLWHTVTRARLTGISFPSTSVKCCLTLVGIFLALPRLFQRLTSSAGRTLRVIPGSPHLSGAHSSFMVHKMCIYVWVPRNDCECVCGCGWGGLMFCMCACKYYACSSRALLVYKKYTKHNLILAGKL